MSAPRRDLSIVKTGLFMIANAMIVHEALVASGAVNDVKPLSSIDKGDPQGWLARSWEQILSENYRSVFDPPLRLLKSLPSHPQLRKMLLDLAAVARKAVSSRAVLRHDLAGRLYHTLLLREVAKGLATYYTSIPAATLLASLAVDQLQVDWSDVKAVSGLRVADFACGSGTLLSAVYSEVVDRHIIASRGKPRVSELHRVLLEEVLYGFDVLEYAIHLTATSLVLRDPMQRVRETNTFVVPLGVHGGSAYLGSLDLEVSGDMLVFPRVRTLLGGFTASPERRGVDSGGAEGLRVERPDLVIMNPPFARTGNVGKSTLFGHLPRAERREVLDKLRHLGKRLAARLGVREGFGRAGLAAYFLLKAYEASKNGGILAFVLPRVFLSGSDWRGIREFLARRGAFKYIIVSDDPGASWAWSENTVLSEILMVYRKCGGGCADDGDATVVYVRRRPRSALEAKIYASIIRSVEQSLTIGPGEAVSPTKAVTLKGSTVMYIYRVKGKALKGVAGVNMNIVAGFHSSTLSAAAYELYTNSSFLGLRLPLVPLREYVRKHVLAAGYCTTGRGGGRRKQGWEGCIGYDVAQVRRKCLDRGHEPVSFLAELKMSTFSSLKVPDKALRKTMVPPECYARAGRLLVAGVARLWLPTIGVVAAYTSSPTLSQVAWTIPLASDEEAAIAAIQALWLNTTPGLVHYLSLRQDSKGGFVQLKKKTLGELLLLDTDRLPGEVRDRLLELASRYAEKSLGSLRNQLALAQEGRGLRYTLDKEFLGILKGEELDVREEEKLRSIYAELGDETLFKNPGSTRQ